LVPNLAVRLNGGRVVQNTEDSIIRIVGLEPYTDYLLTLDDKSLEQISYRIPNKNLRVFVSPNGFRRIDVPILPMGEVNGWVFLKEKNGRKGQERMLVNFYAGMVQKWLQHKPKQTEDLLIWVLRPDIT